MDISCSTVIGIHVGNVELRWSWLAHTEDFHSCIKEASLGRLIRYGYLLDFICQVPILAATLAHNAYCWITNWVVQNSCSVLCPKFFKILCVCVKNWTSLKKLHKLYPLPIAGKCENLYPHYQLRMTTQNNSIILNGLIVYDNDPDIIPL